MPRFHIVTASATDLDAFERGAAEGQSPRHAIPVLVRRLGATLHQTAFSAPTPSLRDRLLSRLIGTPRSWAFVRDFVPRVGRGDVVYCTEENVSVPMASAVRRCADRPKLAVFMVNIDRPRGRLASKLLRIADTVDLFVACCTTQLEFLRRHLKVADDRLYLLLEHLDNHFFTPGPPAPGKRRPVIAAAGMEKRDYRTLAAATHDLDVDVKVGAWSRYAKVLSRSFPDELPANMTRQFYKGPELVQLYRDGDVVVVPVLPCKYAAGVTSLMEAMACNRPVVVTRSPGLSDYLAPPEGVSVVEPSDPMALRAAIVRLLDDPEEAQVMARQGYESAARRYDFDQAVETLARRLEAL